MPMFGASWLGRAEEQGRNKEETNLSDVLLAVVLWLFHSRHTSRRMRS